MHPGSANGGAPCGAWGAPLLASISFILMHIKIRHSYISKFQKHIKSHCTPTSLLPAVAPPQSRGPAEEPGGLRRGVLESDAPGVLGDKGQKAGGRFSCVHAPDPAPWCLTPRLLWRDLGGGCPVPIQVSPPGSPEAPISFLASHGIPFRGSCCLCYPDAVSPGAGAAHRAQK